MLAEFGFERQPANMKPEIELLNLKLADGARVLRLTEPVSGFSLEKRLDPQKPVAEQTGNLKRSFYAFLERESGAAS